MHWFGNIINIAIPILLVFGQVRLFATVTNAVADVPVTFNEIPKVNKFGKQMKPIF